MVEEEDRGAPVWVAVHPWGLEVKEAKEVREAREAREGVSGAVGASSRADLVAVSHWAVAASKAPPALVRVRDIDLLLFFCMFID